MDERIQSRVPVSVVGESIGVKEGGVLQHGLWEIEVEALPKDLPENIEVDVAELQIGDTIRVADLVVAEDIGVLTDPEETVVSIVPPTELKEEELVEEEEILEPEIVGAEEEGEEAEVEAEAEVGEEGVAATKEEAEKKKE